MATNYIAVDSTCLFQSIDLVDSIEKPEDDVLVIVGDPFWAAWNRLEMYQFSEIAKRFYKFPNNTFEILEKEQEKLENTLQELKKEKLLIHLDYEHFYSKISNLEERHCPEIYDLKNQMHKNLFNAPDHEKKFLHTAHPDLEAISYALANQISYNSYNPMVHDGKLAKLMGATVLRTDVETIFLPRNIQPNQIGEFCSNKNKFLNKSESQKKVIKKVCKTSILGIIDQIPMVGNILALGTRIKENFEHLECHELEKTVSTIRSNIIEQTPDVAKEIIDYYAAYRLEPESFHRLLLT